MYVDGITANSNAHVPYVEIVFLHGRLCRYLCVCGGSGASSRDLLLLWQRESWWVYAGGLGSEVDRERYWEAVCHALRKFFSQEEEEVREWCCES